MSLYSAAAVNPEVLQTVAFGLIPAELDFFVTCLVFASALNYILVGDFFSFRFPGMRKDSILRNTLPVSFN